MACCKAGPFSPGVLIPRTSTENICIQKSFLLGVCLDIHAVQRIPLKPRPRLVRCPEKLQKVFRRPSPSFCPVAAARSAGLAPGEVETPPESREEAIQQARTAVINGLGKSLAKQSKGRERFARQARLRLEVPVRDDTPLGQVDLIREVLQGGLRPKKGHLGPPMVVALYFSDPKAATAASSSVLRLDGVSGLRVLTTDSQVPVPEDTVVVVFVGGTEKQIPSMQAIALSSSDRPMLVVNPDWDEASSLPDDLKLFMASFEVCYSFLPIDVQGMVSRMQGAVLKYVQSGPPSAVPWQIFMMSGGEMKFIKKFKTRPSPKELEDVLYNYAAANSPINKSIGFFKGLVGKKK